MAKITNFEYIKSADVQTLAEFICNHTSDCSKCPGEKKCYYKQGYANGLVKWLLEEVPEEYQE